MIRITEKIGLNKIVGSLKNITSSLAMETRLKKWRSGDENVSNKCLLWPIPNVELNYNKAIDPTKDQNPGY